VALCKIRRDWVTSCSRWRDGVRKHDQWSSLDSCPNILWCEHRCSHSMVLREVGLSSTPEEVGQVTNEAGAIMASKTIQRQWIALCNAAALGGSRRARGWCHGGDDGDQMSSLRQWAAPAKHHFAGPSRIFHPDTFLTLQGWSSLHNHLSRGYSLSCEYWPRSSVLHGTCWIRFTSGPYLLQDP